MAAEATWRGGYTPILPLQNEREPLAQSAFLNTTYTSRAPSYPAVVDGNASASTARVTFQTSSQGASPARDLGLVYYLPVFSSSFSPTFSPSRSSSLLPSGGNASLLVPDGASPSSFSTPASPDSALVGVVGAEVALDALTALLSDIVVQPSGEET